MRMTGRREHGSGRGGPAEKDTLLIRFLYRTLPGRCLLRGLTAPSFSKMMGRLLSSRPSRILVPYYIRRYRIDMTGCLKTHFDSFNDFFTREKVLTIEAGARDVISPCDGFLSCYTIGDDLTLRIKKSRYTTAGLLRSDALAAEFSGGDALVFRLEPRHYHRYLYCLDGKIERTMTIPGILHCVRPTACGTYPVYTENARQYTVIRSPGAGTVVQMEIGALMVGRICNHGMEHYAVKGREKGWFEFGGSTIVLLFQKGAVDLRAIKKDLPEGTERPVCIGEVIGQSG